MKPSPYQITAFTHAARERSFSKAASALGVTQSSITQHVAKLERAMGAQLFIRRRDGLELTNAGRELFSVTDRLRTLEQLVEERIADFAALQAGHLSLVANAPRPAMQILAEYTRLHPEVQIEFGLLNWTTAMRRLRHRDVDIAIVTEPDLSGDLYAREISASAYAAHMRRDHPLARRASLSLSALASETIILPEDGSFTQRVFNAKASEHGVVFRRIVKNSTFPVVKEAALHGIGIGILLKDSLFPTSNLAVVDIDEMPEAYRHFLVAPEDKRDLRAVQSFINVAFDQLAT